MQRKIKQHVKKNDMVMVLSGKDKGKSGKVLTVHASAQKVIVEKVNFKKRHTRPTQSAPQGGIIEKECPLHMSNVQILCAKCNLPVRVHKKRLDDGKMVRVCAKCSEILDN